MAKQKQIFLFIFNLCQEKIYNIYVKRFYIKCKVEIGKDAQTCQLLLFKSHLKNQKKNIFIGVI